MFKFHMMVSAAALLVAAFDDPVLPVFKEAKDGKLIFTVGDKEESVDPGEVFSARSRITALNGEAQGHRTKAEAAALKLKDYEGLDAKTAREAIDKLSKIDQKKLIDAGEVDKVREEIGNSFKGQLTDANNKLADMTNKFKGTLLTTAFGGSKYLSDNIAVPLELIQNTFKDLFSVDDDGKITAKDRQGNVIYTRDAAKSGVHADFEEAIQIIIGSYPSKDAILKGNGNSGSGGTKDGANRPGTPNGTKTIKRSEFDALTPGEQQQKGILMGKRELIMVEDR